VKQKSSNVINKTQHEHIKRSGQLPTTQPHDDESCYLQMTESLCASNVQGESWRAWET